MKSIRYTVHDLTAVDSEGREAFRRTFPEELFPLNEGPVLARRDLDGDGLDDSLLTVPVQLGEGNAVGVQDRLEAYTDEGTLLWTQTNDLNPTFGQGPFQPGYRTIAAVAATVKGEPYVLWSQTHHTWWPTILRVLDRRGHVLSAWVHSGAFFALSVLDRKEGPLLLAGGVSNSRASGALLVLNLRSGNGYGPEDAGSPFACLDCTGDDRPLHYFVFPPTELSAAFGVPYSRVYSVSATNRGIEVRSRQGNPAGNPGVDVIYQFDSDFKLQWAKRADDYWLVHRQMELKGSLDHSAEACPERNLPLVVREWTAQGWHDHFVTPRS